MRQAVGVPVDIWGRSGAGLRDFLGNGVTRMMIVGSAKGRCPKNLPKDYRAMKEVAVGPIPAS